VGFLSVLSDSPADFVDIPVLYLTERKHHMKQFKMLLCIVLCITVLCGCEKMIIKEQVVMPPETKETSPVPETVAIKETEAAEFYAYDITVRSAKLAVYSAPGYHYEQMGYITDRGTYTIIAEELENLGGGKATVWGKLSTSGWINLEDAMVEEETEVLTEETEEATEGTKAPFKSYIIKLVNPLVEIYAGPGYQNQIRGEIKDKGSYTIVEESVQTFTGGRSVTWGKLKSGMGWVDLTQIRSESYANALISANYADNYMLSHGEYHHFSQTQEYTIPIAFRAYGKLRDVTLLAMDFDAKGYVPGAELFTLQEMTAEKPLVAELAFPGDMTTYGIRFLDESGISHDCIIYISGRNGALVLQED
jgi:hypothetical protein